MFMKNAKGSELGKVDGRRQRCMKNLLNINAAYKILAESYTRIMQPDKAKEYQDKLSAGY